MRKNYYYILEVSKNASQEVIKNAYKALVKKYHPDNFQTEREKKEAEEKIKKVFEAFEVLGDEDKRKAYDKEFYSSERNSEEPPPEEPKPEEKSNLNTKTKLQRTVWVTIAFVVLFLGTGSYFGYQSLQRQAIIRAEKKAEDNLNKDLAIDLEKEALYQRLLEVTNSDFQMIPDIQVYNYRVDINQIGVINEKKAVIERGKAIQVKRQENITDFSRVASSTKNKEFQEAINTYKVFLMSDSQLIQTRYNQKLNSFNDLIDFASGKIKFFFQFPISRELIPVNSSVNQDERDKLLKVLEKKIGKEQTNSLIDTSKQIAIKQVAEDFQIRLPDIYSHFQGFFK